MERFPRRARLLAWLLLILLVSIIGIKHLEGFSFLDALWFTVVSLTMIGYGDIVPVTPAGRVFTMFIILCGIGFVLYVFGTGFAAIMEGKLSELLGRQGILRNIQKLVGHIIICGAGRFGRQVIEHFRFKTGHRRIRGYNTARSQSRDRNRRNKVLVNSPHG